MRRIILFLFFSAVICSANSWAQIGSATANGLSSYSMHNSSADPDPSTPEWQLTLDVIQAKSEALLQKNNRLMSERAELIKEYTTQQETIESWQKKNQELRDFLKQRHGRTDDEAKIDELKQQINQKKTQFKGLQDRLAELNKQVQSIEETIQLKKLKASDLQIERTQENLQKNVQEGLTKEQASQDGQALGGFKQKLQQEKAQEEELTKELNNLKYHQMAATADPHLPDDATIKDLEAKADNLRKQKEDLQNRFNSDNSQANLHRYQGLMTKKNELQEKIKSFEAQLNQLKKSQSKSMLDTKPNKPLLKQMIQLDSQNARLRQRITNMSDDVDLLKTQVRRLERRISTGG